MGKPRFRESREASGLARINGLGRGDERPGAARLHLDERVTTSVAADEVDLSETRADVPGYDAETMTPELALRQMFAREAKDTARVHARRIGRALR